MDSTIGSCRSYSTGIHKFTTTLISTKTGRIVMEVFTENFDLKSYASGLDELQVFIAWIGNGK